jgi:hypothetical protein
MRDCQKMKRVNVMMDGNDNRVGIENDTV